MALYACHSESDAPNVYTIGKGKDNQWFKTAVGEIRTHGYPCRAAKMCDVSVAYFSGEFEMRTLFGIILGAAITVGAAYMHDSSAMQNGGGAARTIVNWDVATEVTDNALRGLRRQIDRLLAK